MEAEREENAASRRLQACTPRLEFQSTVGRCVIGNSEEEQGTLGVRGEYHQSRKVRREGGDELFGQHAPALLSGPPWPRVSCLPAKPDRARSLRHALVGLSQILTVVCEGAVLRWSVFVRGRKGGRSCEDRECSTATSGDVKLGGWRASQVRWMALNRQGDSKHSRVLCRGSTSRQVCVLCVPRLSLHTAGVTFSSPLARVPSGRDKVKFKRRLETLIWMWALCRRRHERTVDDSAAGA
jgi:hypothetical protein